MREGEDKRTDADIAIQVVDQMAHAVIRQMTPVEIGRLLHPDAELVKLKRVPPDVVADHLTRYSRQELKRGQFFRVGERYTFIMDHAAYDKRRH